MCERTLRYCPSPEVAVRLLLTTVMGLVLAVMMVVGSQQVSAQNAVPNSSGLPRDEIVARLDAAYDEAPVAGGIAANGSILEVFASPGGGSWTIIVTRPDGMSSIVAEGEGWSFLTVLKGMRI